MNVKWQRKWWIIAIGSLLSACGGGGDSDTAGGAGETEPEEISEINDPLLEHQWYLYNNGQRALTYYGSGGVPGADINVFDANNLYAGGFSGKGIEVAIVDSGLQIEHEDLRANVIENGSYNFLSSSNGLSRYDPSPTGTGGDHGTGVAGLIGARGGNGLGIWGVAPLAKLRGFNFFASQTYISEELGSLGDQTVTEYYPGLGENTLPVSIFNRSYGTNPDLVIAEDQGLMGIRYGYVMSTLKWGAENLRDGKGAIYVKAGGNEYADVYGADGLLLDCSAAIDHDVTCYNVNMETENISPYQIIVGGFNASDERSSFSSTGSALWISAPGGEDGLDSPGILATDVSGCSRGYSTTSSAYGLGFDRGESSENAACNYYSRFGGTSASTPIVSGVVALMLEANPDLSWHDVKHILATTARKIDPDLQARFVRKSNGSGFTNVVLENGWVENAAGYAYSNAYGFGAVNAVEAIRMALEWGESSTHLAQFESWASEELTVSGENTIPDNDATGLSQVFKASRNTRVESVVVTLSIEGVDDSEEGEESHNIDAADYQIVLESPSGTRSILLTPYNLYQPHYDMKGLRLSSHAFYGESTIGEEPDAGWTLTVRDLNSDSDNGLSGLGKLTGWSLTFYGTSQ
ncbi:S8 family serine peptidase [Thiomicrorhabdus sp.]|uniref:S8 family serine peptidase n=1 Tax=Thiomicrorhabdus sp. TaxID=2039724 RepID=UPI0029C8BD45|nr:S8 family serine peptidase [Thiomicrorhabdus sp.]